MLPTMKIGKLEISRLIVGSNPFSGKSHMSADVDSDMKSHFTEETVFSMLDRCRNVGINAVQSRGSHPIMDLLYRYRKQRGGIHWLAQTGKNLQTFDEELEEMMKYEPSAVCIHGELADDLLLTDRLHLLSLLLDKLRKTGLPVGVCSHFPEVLAYSEKEALNPDYYMASVYNLFQPDRSHDLVKTGERFEYSDVPKMYEVIRGLSAPTIALKILGAGRRCGTQEEVKSAFVEAFNSMKIGDGVLVGMFDKYVDQVSLNAEYVKEAIALNEKAKGEL